MRRRRAIEWLLSAPTLLWLGVFFALPTLLIFALAFKPATINGGIGAGWTLDTWLRIGNPSYPAILWRTVWLSFATTVICICLGVPVAYWIARLPKRFRHWALILIILPFWTNFLIRVFAWRTLLHPDGFVKQVLMRAGLADINDQLLYNQWAILLVLVYTYLPFAILPLYAAAEKFDFGLLDAARDLGSTRWSAFRKVFLPGIRVGMLTAVLIVFIPALGSYAIPEIVGGPTSEMIGNKIAQRVFTERSLPDASALSAVLAIGVFIPLILLAWLRRRSGAALEQRAGGTV
jgi:spermidine/putrescine transport system permease protein